MNEFPISNEELAVENYAARAHRTRNESGTGAYHGIEHMIDKFLNVFTKSIISSASAASYATVSASQVT